MGHKSAPGSYTKNGVNQTLNPPFGQASGQKKGVGGGMYDANRAPFDKPHSMGGGAIPNKFFDGMTAKVPKSSGAGGSTPIGITKRNPSERTFKNGR